MKPIQTKQFIIGGIGPYFFTGFSALCSKSLISAVWVGGRDILANEAFFVCYRLCCAVFISDQAFSGKCIDTGSPFTCNGKVNITGGQSGEGALLLTISC